ncbi:hypothetical protein [Methylorubrum zatmanii]
MTTEPRPLERGAHGTPRDKQYHQFECVECGKTEVNSFCEPHRTDMLQRRLCFLCNFWVDFKLENLVKLGELTIIEGHVYTPGNRTSGAFRGMAGRRFDIEYVAPSIYAGQRTTTFDLWSGAAIPERLRPEFPDTARFLGGAEKAQAGDTTCWNPSDRRPEPYPLPQDLKPSPPGVFA